MAAIDSKEHEIEEPLRSGELCSHRAHEAVVRHPVFGAFCKCDSVKVFDAPAKINDLSNYANIEVKDEAFTYEISMPESMNNEFDDNAIFYHLIAFKFQKNGHTRAQNNGRRYFFYQFLKYNVCYEILYEIYTYLSMY